MRRMLLSVLSGFLALAAARAAVLPPTVTSTSPLNGAIDVSINNRPTATFSTAMDPATITPVTFTLKQGSTPVSGAVTLNGVTNTATFTPATPLGLNLVYTATVTTGAKDLGGLPLAANRIWSFTTAACSQGPVTLGSASNFVVLAGSAVTSTGPTSITGDLGVSPGTSVTGSPTVVGTQHVADPTAAAAQLDLTTAYNDAAGRTLCPVSVAGNIGGQTLTPGLYKSTSSLAISSGDLTLDAQGDGNAVFIFQIASTLNTTDGRQVILTNGAKSANIFWQVGTSASLGTGSVFQGTIMADQSITLKTGATLNGRALARIAAVTLDNNTIVTLTPTGVAGGAGVPQPAATALVGVFPNPFNPTTIIRYDLAAEGAVSLGVYGLLGQPVRTLVDRRLPAGRYSITWDGLDEHGRPAASGTYLVRLTTLGAVMTQRATLLR